MATKKKKAPEPAVRKSLLITGGVAVGAALLGFVLMTFLGGGGGGEEEAATELATLGGATIPIASGAPVAGGPGTDPIELTPGGRDPFVSKAPPSAAPAGSSSGPAPAPVPAAAPVPAPAAAPVAYVPPPAPVAQPQPAPQQPAPAPQPTPAATPRPVYPKQTITVIAIYAESADVRIDDTVYEGARTDDELTERFHVGSFEGRCFFMKDRFPPDSQEPERFELCADDTVTR
jgi:hypothetical protein